MLEIKTVSFAPAPRIKTLSKKTVVKVAMVTAKVEEKVNTGKAPAEGAKAGEEALWYKPNEEEYKTGRLAAYQRMLRARGITDKKQLRLLTAQLLVENGALSETIHGDNGCSVGIPQYNACVHHGMKAERFLEKHPEWKDWKFQMERMADMVAERYALYDGNMKQVVTHHNSPVAAKRGVDTAAGYYSKVVKMSSRLASL